MTDTDKGAKHRLPPPEDDRAILRSSDAKDVTWFFRFAASAVGGLQACDARKGEAETLLEPRPLELPSKKTCRKCGTVVSFGALACSKCGRHRFWWQRVPRGEDMAVKASHNGASIRSTEKSERQIAAAVRERRVREGLEKIDRLKFNALRLWGESKQHGPEIRNALGQGADLAMRLPRCLTAYERYLAGLKGGEPVHSLELWLTKLCAKRAEHKGALDKIRDEAEFVVSEALHAYRAVRVKATKREEDGLERFAVNACRLPKYEDERREKIKRPGLFKRLDAEEAKRKRAPRVDRGIPFMPEADDA